ncbi:ovotransferrin [Protobothrops mucrosquamatus]|uniref:ovotransferrin n=1 Tax=Protobothrops mucrosquamatus TaxID=103944 RepID=UPI0007756058|nr:ovotransferrin [Protobothrops mucrosquamatus]
MKFALQATLSFGLLALCLASSSVRWCTVSNEEQEKCLRLKRECFPRQQSMDFPELVCVRKTDHQECIVAIKNLEADAITLDAGLILEASLNPYYLKPVVAELHTRGSGVSSTSYYAVAVVKKGTVPSLGDLKNKISCHTGYGRSAGWNIPMGILLELKLLLWGGKEEEPLENAVGKFFQGGCVPGLENVPNMCSACAGNCGWNDPFAGYAGAYQCLKSGKGDVAFVNEAIVLADSPEERSKYELLCLDGTRKPVEQYESCHLARVSSHAVVARPVDDWAGKIWALLSYALEQNKQDQSRCQLFGSPLDSGKDLLFKDSTVSLVQVPEGADAELYLGPKYCAAIKNLKRERADPDPGTTERIVWCAVGKAEQKKCDVWSGQSNGDIECAVADTTDECLVKIIKGEADAITLDGGHVYTAGKCGLVPVLTEIPPEDSDACIDPTKGTKVKGYTVVAVAKKNTEINWTNLRGKKSCHTGVGRTAGWNVPMGLLNEQNNLSCNFDQFFAESCAPGAPPESSLCKLCKGSGGEGGLSQKHKCKPNSNEIYYSYKGALRCLNEVGDVAFVKHTTITEVTEGDNKPAWASGLVSSDFVLLNLNGDRCRHDEYATCHLAQVCNHAVVARPERAEAVKNLVLKQQKLFGKHGTQNDVFQMFQSEAKDSLFKDGTECVAVPSEDTFEKYLGEEYLQSLEGLAKCSSSKLLKVCTFHTHDW